MRKSSKKILTASLAAAFACSVAGGLALSAPIASFADANVMEVERLFETFTASSAVAQKSVMFTTTINNETQIVSTVKGLQLLPEAAGAAWNAKINARFTGNTSITYFLPNQYGGNGIEDTVANAFTVHNADGQAVATFVVCGNHWSLLSTTRAYLYNNATDVYTTQTMTYPTGGHRTYAGVGELTLAADTVHPALSGWGHTADMYVAPKVGTQVNGTWADDEDGTGSVYFDYDDTTDTLTVKTDTYKLASPATSECAGNGQIIEVGSVNADLSAGYTISVGSAPAIGTFTYEYSSSVVLTAINGVDVTGESVSVTGDVADIRYDDEQEINGENVIYLFQGEELKAFDVYTRFVAGGVLQSNSVTKSFEVTASESFKDKATGRYDLTVTAKANDTQGDFTKDYTVVVLPSYAVATGNLIKPVANAKITSQKTYGQYKGVAIERENDSDKQRVAMLDGVFNGEMSVTYMFNGVSGDDANQKEAHAIDIYNAAGEKVASAVNYWVQAWQGKGGRMYLHDIVNDEFMQPTATGYGSMDVTTDVVNDNGTPDDDSDDTTTQVTAPKTLTSMYAGVEVAPLPLTSPENVNFDGTFYDVDTVEGTLQVIYDDAAKTLTVKISTAQKVRLTPNNERNEGKTENLSSPSPFVTVGVIKDIDLSAGYTVGFSDPTSFNGDDNQFTQNSTSVLVTAVNGVSVTGESVSAISCGVVSATLTWETYELDSEQPTSVYIAKNATLDTLKVTVQKQMLGGWNAFAEADEVEIIGEYDLATAGEYPVALKVLLEGIPYQTDIKLVVEESREIAFDTDGGKLINSFYISQHSWKYQIPTPVKYGWQFIGWFDGETQVTAITQDMAAVTLKAKWLDEVAPTVALNGLSGYEVVDNVAAFVLQKTDVLAEDEACGILGAEYITIYVKAPGATEFLEYSSFTFDSSLYGLYEVRYDVVDFSGNGASIQRTVFYTSVRPVLTVGGEVAQTANVGDMISLPAATATSGQTALTVQVSVVFGGGEVAIQEGTFTADKAGTYTVSYYAVDAQGAVAQQTFTVVVTEAQTDGQPPQTTGGCQSSVSLIAGGSLVLLGAALYVDKKRKNK